MAPDPFDSAPCSHRWSQSRGHRVELKLADSQHKVLDSNTVQFMIRDKIDIPQQH